MPSRPPRTKAEKQNAVHTVMHEFKHGTLHSGSKSGPKVKSRDQAVAIAMSESRQSKPKMQRGPRGQERINTVKSVPPATGKAPPMGGGESQPGYDRSSHFPGNPGFPGSRKSRGGAMGKAVANIPSSSRGSSLVEKGGMSHDTKNPTHGIGAGTSSAHTGSMGGSADNFKHPHPSRGERGSSLLEKGGAPHAGQPSGRSIGAGGSPHSFKPPVASNSHGYGHSGGQRSGAYRLSGHSGAHRIGKR